jgi:DNA polymerase-3 subunit delta'
MLKSHIWVTEFNEQRETQLRGELKGHKTVWFRGESILVDTAREIITESHISEKDPKFIVIEGKKFPPVTQNALLKVLEEPPKNIYFILIVPSKSILLQTVLSRLTVRAEREKRESSFSKTVPNLEKLTLQSLKALLREWRELKGRDAIDGVQQTLQRNSGYNFSEDDLNRFSMAIRLLELHSNSGRVFLMLFLPFILKK